MTNELEYDLTYVPGKRSRNFHYEMKVISKETRLVLHARKSKKGGASFSKLLGDASFLLFNGFMYDFEDLVKKGELEKIIAIQKEQYESSAKIMGVPLIGWSPEVIERMRKIASEVKKDE